MLVLRLHRWSEHLVHSKGTASWTSSRYAALQLDDTETTDQHKTELLAIDNSYRYYTYRYFEMTLESVFVKILGETSTKRNTSLLQMIR